ncbi:cyclophilin-like fold protein [Streptomyces sp. R44]|uniref:Cyclophilin-like fold protein n=1 Tax=Streptomyces sp. R44 TaxID=3238633 RepID=A0AB39SPS2_9ACTN
MDIRVTLDGRTVDATLNYNPAAYDLADLLPLTLNRNDFHGTERIADHHPRKLITADAHDRPRPGSATTPTPHPWGNLALVENEGPIGAV